MNLSEAAEGLSAIAALRDRGDSMPLATIVSVSGYIYRAGGPSAGSRRRRRHRQPVGCLEAQVAGIAGDVMRSGERYDLTADDEVVWG